jgi:hypothetical protein
MANTTPTNPPNPPNPPLKSLRFAFPFRKKAEGQGKNPAEITDEHEFHKLLKKEPSGSYSISSKGMWHGGIHITEGGAGQSLDLSGGVRCIADGEVVAWRMNRTYPVSELPTQGGQPAISAPYSTGFALVRHTMEFPRGTRLTFFSLYMHLQDFAGYESEKTLPRPPYWAPEFKVTEFARDKPSASPHGRAAPVEQKGLRVRTTHPHGTPVCILPQGAQFSISERSGNWGKIKDTQGAQPYPPKAGGFVAPAAAIGGWAFLGRENGGEVVSEIMPDSAFDRVVIPPTPIKVKAGDLIGHLGRYDSLNQRTSNRMVHIEVFCGEDIKTFLLQGRAWLDEHAFKTEDWKELGLPSDPTILRVAKGTKLYQEAFNEGNDAPRTDVVLVHNFAELAKRPNNRRTETTAGGDQLKLNWWKVDGANMLRNDISGWVREKNFAGGRVTREFAQSWTDFETFDDSHDPTHTMFATAKAYVDYVMGANVPEPAALGKLSPLMAKVYRAIYSTGDGSRAADELCDAANDPWRAWQMSRLIIKHESEWANPAKWQQLIQEIERQTGVKPQHEAEKKRIEKLVWWDEVKQGVADLPESDVFHIHPIGLVGNFTGGCDCRSRFLKISKIVLLNEGGYVNDPNDSGGATNKGIAWDTWTAYAKSDIGVDPTLDNLKILTDEQAEVIYFNHYWEPRGFCGIKNEKTALNIYDWTITSGKAIKKIKEVLIEKYKKEIEISNSMSSDFIDEINSIEDQDDLTINIGVARKKYYISGL